MKKSTSVNCAVAIVLPLSALMRLMSLRTTRPSAPREKPICAGTIGVQLASVHRQHVGGRDRRGDLAFVQRRPVLAFADREPDLEAVVLEEHGVLGRLQAAVGGNQPA